MTSKYTSKLAGQRVMVLGATSGIGFCVAEAAFENGAHLVLSSSNQSKLDKTVARLRETYPERTQQTIVTQVCDLSDVTNLDRNIETLFKAATNNGELKLNHIASTAGDGLSIIPIAQATPEAIYTGMTVRFTAQAILAKYIPTYMEVSPNSSFTFTSGARGKRPAAGWSLITAMCGAVEGLMRGLTVDLRPIRVNVVSPGAVHTELFDQFPREALEPMLESFRQATTTGTVGTPADVAESYIYLMKDNFATGSVIDSNGGSVLV
ncbi:NAD(P)-binding protein [Penicillium chermesinum]|uniref:NAD(P)-binding protein n=1 Tax=Penicillium chermesinum TaxID=63820 RepID=A0A9W9NBZ0_9EURO|nr:NAD(P)-binding protein [Penicillium chermesinum]KAJ5217065.1 NAD(P)-binding protein [Penicillium chermesinum]